MSYMTVRDLSREQLDELKANHIARQGDVSYGELAEAPYVISDETIYREYDGFVFVADDFWCEN